MSWWCQVLLSVEYRGEVSNVLRVSAASVGYLVMLHAFLIFSCTGDVIRSLDMA